MSTRSSSPSESTLAHTRVFSTTRSRRFKNTWTTYGALRMAGTLTVAERIERVGRPLNAVELAEFLNVSRITIFKQAKAGRIPSFRVGTCVRFDPKAVARWLRTM